MPASHRGPRHHGEPLLQGPRGPGNPPTPAWALLLGLIGLLGVPTLPSPAEAQTPPPASDDGRFRVALYNIWQLSTEKVDSVGPDGRGAHPQLLAAAEHIRSVRPDILVLNEVDLARGPDGALDGDDLGRVARNFAQRYLAHGQGGLDYPYVFSAPSNTGDLSGLDLNRDGTTATPEDRGTRTYGDDSWGYGEYPGQYAMAVLSRFPLDPREARTFRLFRWSDLPGNRLPRDFYGAEVADSLRLSSKSHWDVPVRVPGPGGQATLHLLVSHPTPQGFDGAENRNGLRNWDEIGFWVRYLDGDPALRDDAGVPGGFQGGAFILAGDLNSAPDGDNPPVDGRQSVLQLLEDPRIQDPPPLRGQGTGTWGNRIDYLLPSLGVEILGGGVVPDPERRGSDHYLVWLDLRVPTR